MFLREIPTVLRARRTVFTCALYENYVNTVRKSREHRTMFKRKDGIYLPQSVLVFVAQCAYF